MRPYFAPSLIYANMHVPTADVFHIVTRSSRHRTFNAYYLQQCHSVVVCRTGSVLGLSGRKQIGGQRCVYYVRMYVVTIGRFKKENYASMKNYVTETVETRFLHVSAHLKSGLCDSLKR